MSSKQLTKYRRIWTTICTLAGSCLEYYNYMVFMCLIPLWGQELFSDSSNIITKGFAIVLISALVRPAAASILGTIGDKVGRKYALLLSGIIMSTACIIMSLLPRHDPAHWMTRYNILSILIVLCRVLQIASVSGKLNGFAIFLIEHFPQRAGMISGAVWGTTILGMLCAALVELKYSHSYVMGAWRSPIAWGGIISLLWFIAMYYINDGDEYAQSQYSQQTVNAFSRRLAHFVVFCIGSAIGGMFYFCASYLPLRLSAIRLIEDIALYKCCLLIIYIISTITAGVLVDYLLQKYQTRPDRVPVLWYIMGLGVAGTTILPLLSLIMQQSPAIFACTILSLGLFVGPSHKLLYDLFPPQSRYRSISVYYGLGTAIFGGSVTYICIQLERIHTGLPVIFMIICSGLGGIALICSYRLHVRARVSS